MPVTTRGGRAVTLCRVAACLAWAVAGMLHGSVQAQSSAPSSAVPLTSGQHTVPTALPPIKVGLIGPFSGPSAAFGLPMMHGVRMAVDEINAAGGYLGRPLELVVRDDMARASVGLARSQELVAEGVVATIGFCNAGVAHRALEVFQQARVPLLIPCATADGLTRRYEPSQSYVFRVAPRDAMQIQFAVDQMVRRGWKRVAVLADATSYGEDGLAELKAALSARGMRPVYTARFALGTTDFRPELEAARKAGANVLWIHTVGPDSAAVGRARMAAKWDVPLAGAWPLSFPFFLQAGAAAEGAWVVQTHLRHADSSLGRTAILARYRRPDEPWLPMVSAQAYDATWLLWQAVLGIAAQATVEGPAIRQALERLPRRHAGWAATYDRPFSPTDKDAITPGMLTLGRVRSGRVITVD